MLDWMWKGLAGIAGFADLMFGISADRTRRRMEREKAEHEAAQKKIVEDAYTQLEEARKKYAAKAPINPNKRTDFE